MTRRPKDIGTAAESAVVKVLREHGFPHAERRALRGSADWGDVTGTPGLVWEVKGGDAAKDASDNQIADWMDEAQTEAGNAGATYGFLIVARRRKNVRDWWAVIDVCDLAKLVRRDALNQSSNLHCRLTLAQLVELLTLAGWASTN